MDDRLDGKALIIGITGIIGSGKSSVADIISQEGVTVLYSDNLSKQLMNENAGLKNKINNEFGAESYDNNALNTEYLSSEVFNDSKKLENLNSIVHPYVIDVMINKIEALLTKGIELIFIESALMLETGTAEGFDYLITVKSPVEDCIKRVQKRSGLSEVEIMKRMGSQLSQEKKVQLSDFTINNDKSLDDLKNATITMLNIIKSLPQKRFDD